MRHSAMVPQTPILVDMAVSGMALTDIALRDPSLPRSPKELRQMREHGASMEALGRVARDLASRGATHSTAY